MPFRILGPKGHVIVRKASLAHVKQLLPRLRRRFGHIRVVKIGMPPLTKRQKIVKWARWGVAHEPTIHYSEEPIRSSWLAGIPGTLPLTTDCSGFATACYRWAGAPDPNGLGYVTVGYTGTLLDHANRAGHVLTDISKAKPGDLIVYGPGTGAHVAIVVEAGPDPLTVSHGREGGPEYVRVSQDGRKPQRICSYL